MRLSLEDRFWPKVDRRGDDECWPWLAGTIRQRYPGPRYGAFRLRAGELGLERSVVRPAHRVAFHLVHGRWPDPFGLHGCDNPPCCNAVNPDHVHEGTPLLNVQECIARGRARLVEQQPGEGNSLAKLTNDQARVIREQYAGGVLLRELSADFGVSMGQISLLVRGLSYPDAGGPLAVGDQRTVRHSRGRVPLSA